MHDLDQLVPEGTGAQAGHDGEIEADIGDGGEVGGGGAVPDGVEQMAAVAKQDAAAWRRTAMLGPAGLNGKCSMELM